MNKFVSLLLCGFMLLSTSFISLSEVKHENVYAEIYVDSHANEKKADGTKEHPYVSIDKAKEKVKSLSKDDGDIIVHILEGTYYFNETLNFLEEDSGSDKCYIKYIAEGNVVFSGGKIVQDKWVDEGNGIYSTSYNRDKKLRALYVNGKRCYMTSKEIRALGGTNKYSITKGEKDWAWSSGEAFSSVMMSKGIPEDTINQDDIELMTQTTWNTTIVCAESITNNGFSTVVNLQMPYGAFAQNLSSSNAYKINKMNTVYNVFEWLDEPGEFYFDKTNHKLYYYPREDEDLNTAQVVVPEVEQLINIEGSSIENNVHHILFEGITFAYTDWNLYEIDGSHGRATNQSNMSLIAYAEKDFDGNIHGNVYREYDVSPAAVMITSANNIIFKNNIICHTGNDGLSLVNDVNDCVIDGNIIYDLSGTAMLIGHIQHMYIGDKNSNKGRHSDKEKYDKNTEGLCKDITITNNLFKDMSLLFLGDPGVTIYAVENMDFKFNQIENTPYSGLSLGWGWWNYNGDSDSIVPEEPAIVTNNVSITNNRFINCITKLGDGGAIYTLGDMPNTIISENYINSIGTEGATAAYHIRGIHLDEGTQHVYGEKNVIDINPEFACVDCGNWGRKGNNTWNNNYSTSELYTTTGSYEPGTQILNPIFIENNEMLSEDVLAIINNAGIKSEYLSKIENMNFYNGPILEDLNNKSNVGLYIAIIAVDVVVIIVCLLLIVSKTKNKS